MVISSSRRANVARPGDKPSQCRASRSWKILRSPREAWRNCARRDAGGAVEGADEIGQIAEADVIGDVGDRAVVVGQQPRRVAQPRAHQILMRRDAEHAGEQPQEMERADARPARRRASRSICSVRMRVDPQRGFHRAAAVARARGRRLCAAGRKPPRRTGWPAAGRSRRGRYRCGHLLPPAPVRRAPSVPAAAARDADLPDRRRGRRSLPPVPAPGRTTGTRRRRRCSWVQMYSSPGWPISTDPATSSKLLAAACGSRNCPCGT